MEESTYENEESAPVNEETIEIKETYENSSLFNIIDSNISPSLIPKFSSDIIEHIFKYNSNTGSIELSSEYENILMSKKINIIEYMNNILGCRDVYDIKCTGVRIKKIDDTIRKKISQWLMHDEKYYVSFYFYIATPCSLFEAYLLVITGKKNAVTAGQLSMLGDLQNKSNLAITDLQKQLGATTDEINHKHEQLQEIFVQKVQLLNDNTTKQLSVLNNQMAENIENISNQFTNKLNSVQVETEGVLTDLQKQLTTNATDTQTTLKEVMNTLETKLDSITAMFKKDMNNMLSKLNEEIKNIQRAKTQFK